MPLVESNGIRLNVIEIDDRRPHTPPGVRTPVVFIHGLAASSAFWYAAGAQVLSLLGPGLLYDLRGHGRSEAPRTGYSATEMARDLRGLLDAKGIAAAHLVAHSFGGMIALLFALHAPDRVRSLVLADVRVRALQERLSLPKRSIPPRLARRLTEIGVDAGAETDGGEGIDYLSNMARIQNPRRRGYR